MPVIPVLDPRAKRELAIRHDEAMTDVPISSASGDGDGHFLYRHISGPENLSLREDLLVTPRDEREFIGQPYPAPGLRVRGPARNPPWLVVDHYIERVIVARWPVRLWRVQNIEAAPPEHQVNDWYTRATSLEIVEELPTGTLFGRSGSEVVKVIDKAYELRADQVALLARSRSRKADVAYRNVWQRWTDLGQSGSPVGNALVLIHHGVDRSAKTISPLLFRYDPVDEVDVLSDGGWVTARAALLEAAVGLGALGLTDSEEREALTEAWKLLVSMADSD